MSGNGLQWELMDQRTVDMLVVADCLTTTPLKTACALSMEDPVNEKTLALNNIDVKKWSGRCDVLT